MWFKAPEPEGVGHDCYGTGRHGRRRQHGVKKAVFPQDEAQPGRDLCVAENEVKRRVTQGLERVGLAGYELRSPHHLSLGEKKRVALATVLSMGPEVLALDEPTSNLDPGGRWSLIGLLRGLVATKIVASHDLELVRALCRRVVLLDRGGVVADGATDEILADVGLLSRHGLAPSAG